MERFLVFCRLCSDATLRTSPLNREVFEKSLRRFGEFFIILERFGTFWKTLNVLKCSYVLECFFDFVNLLFHVGEGGIMLYSKNVFNKNNVSKKLFVFF